MLGIGKKLGLSFLEINELTCQELFDLADSMYPNEDEPVEATQDDIDKFFN